MTQRAVYPIEVALPSEITLRGVEHSEDGPPVVFVHDAGDDLDAWGSTPKRVAAGGFRVICLEQRGHGLSDGDPDPGAALQDLREALAVIRGSFGPVGLVAYGSVAAAALSLGIEDGAPVHVLLSPLPATGTEEDLTNAVPAIRALFVGTYDEPADSYVRSLYQRLPGQKMWFSTGTHHRGVGLLDHNPHTVEQLSLFLRRHLTGYHLAWIAEHHAGKGTSGDERPTSSPPVSTTDEPIPDQGPES